MLFDMQPIVAKNGLNAAAAATVVSVWMAVPVGVLTDRVAAGVLVPIGLLAVGASSPLLWVAE